VVYVHTTSGKAWVGRQRDALANTTCRPELAERSRWERLTNHGAVRAYPDMSVLVSGCVKSGPGFKSASNVVPFGVVYASMTFSPDLHKLLPRLCILMQLRLQPHFDASQHCEFATSLLHKGKL
jgi:hypothetical protein